MAEEEELEELAEVEEGDDPMGIQTQSSTKQPRGRTHNYNQVEDLALCDTWMNKSMDATVGTD